MKGNARFLARVIVGLFAVWLVGCSTTVSTSSGPVSDVRGKPGAPEEGDAARRAQVRLELASAYFSEGAIDVGI